MGKWSEALQSEPAQQPVVEPAGKWSSSLRQTDEQRLKLSGEMEHHAQPGGPTRAELELPEFGSGGLLASEDKAKVAALSPVFLATTSPEEIADIVTKNFPAIGRQEDEQGNIILGNNKTGTKVIVNRPGISKLDILQSLGIMAAFAPSGMAGAAASGFGKAAQVGAGALASGATETAIQGLQKATGGDFDAGEIGLSTSLGGLSEMGDIALKSFKTGRQARQLRTEKSAIDEVKKEVGKAVKTEQKTGIRLFPGQKTLDPFALEEQSYVASLPAAARKARLRLKGQNQEAFRAVDDFMSQLSQPGTVPGSSRAIRDIAEESITNASLARSKEVGPIFKKVWEQKKVIDTSKIVESLDNTISEYGDGKIKTLLKKVKRSVLSASEPVNGSNTQKLHNLKREIWAQIESFEREAPLNKEIKATLKGLYGDVVEQLRNEVPSYSKAMEKYIEKSPYVEELTKGVIGKVSKIKDENLKQVTSVIFDQAETNPKVLKTTMEVIKKSDPEAWNSIVRAEVQKRIKTIDLDVSNLTPDNAPAKLHRAMFGSGLKRKILLDSLEPEHRMNALFLEDALKRASLGRPGGSQTGVRNVINDKLKGAHLALIRFFKNPVQRVVSTGEESAFNKSAEKLGDALFDVKWQPQISKIRKSKDIPASIKAMTQLLNDIENENER